MVYSVRPSETSETANLPDVIPPQRPPRTLSGGKGIGRCFLGLETVELKSRIVMRLAARSMRAPATPINQTTQRNLLLRRRRLGMKPRRLIVAHCRFSNQLRAIGR